MRKYHTYADIMFCISKLLKFSGGHRYKELNVPALLSTGRGFI